LLVERLDAFSRAAREAIGERRRQQTDIRPAIPHWTAFRVWL